MGVLGIDIHTYIQHIHSNMSSMDEEKKNDDNKNNNNNDTTDAGTSCGPQEEKQTKKHECSRGSADDDATMEKKRMMKDQFIQNVGANVVCDIQAKGQGTLELCVEKALQNFVGEGTTAEQKVNNIVFPLVGSGVTNVECGHVRPEDIHVLVVDDEVLSRTVVSSLLKKFKYSVTVAEDGAEAMELLRSNPPGTFHLVLTDVHMPQMNGIELLQYIQSEDTLRSVPVVMMSSFDNGDIVYECVEGGAEEYLVKPVTHKEVRHLWQHVLKKRSVATTVPQFGTVSGEQGRERKKDDGEKSPSVDQTLSEIHDIRVQSSITSAFLKMMRDTRLKEFQDLKNQVMQLEEDCDALSHIASDEDGSLGSADHGRVCKRKIDLSWLDTQGLDKSYFSKIHKSPKSQDGSRSLKDLKDFASNLNVVSQRSGFVVESTIRSGNMANPQEMVCYSDFDAEDAHFATVSVSRSVKVFDFASMLDNQNALQFPVWQATTRSKLSSVSWNSYIRSHLITSDYEGAIQLWDVASGSSFELNQFEDHEKRVWSVDFSQLDPMQFASASDDATVRIWNLQQSSSVACLKTPSNACSVHYSPKRATMLAVACANHCSYIFDTRRVDSPLAVLSGANRAVSYVRFMDASTVIGASTDNAIRSWDVSNVTDTPLQTAQSHQEEYTGHVNERNFVGLSVHSDGYIATGSEDNKVYCYYKAFPFALTTHAPVCGKVTSNDAGPPTKPGVNNPRTFISSVCWARHSKHLLVGNSEGVLQVLQLKEFSNGRK